MTAPLDTQAAAVRHIHSIAVRSGEASEQTLQWASQAIRTLEWLHSRPDMMALIKIVDAFKGGELYVRDVSTMEDSK